MNIYEEIARLKIIPVVVLDDEKDALPLADALIAGGLPAAEITFRTAAAEGSIRAITAERPDMLVGAGTITTLDQARRAISAGAGFLVTPGFSDEVTAYAVEQDVPIFPGVCTPTEIMMTLQYDLPVVKFFPAQQNGGLAAIKALNGPFPALKFMPTGGISAANVKEYLAYPNIAACGGSWMVKKDLINAGKFDEIRRLAAEAAALANS
ncbi:MAG: bifunctional 4-hydroxy-2-oxoglutarate aldolase/2-dehydro-3-deoxy-phosphogluconate aldolase [Oscillospiraceae bacterium]